MEAEWSLEEAGEANRCDPLVEKRRAKGMEGSYIPATSRWQGRAARPIAPGPILITLTLFCHLFYYLDDSQKKINLICK
jgi:hypothetical protein